MSKITVEIPIDLPAAEVWKLYTTPEHVLHWNTASEDWHTVNSVIELEKGGKFAYRMEAKDGSMGFDFEGKFDEVIPEKSLSYTLLDGRKVTCELDDRDKHTVLKVTFDAEKSNSLELQEQGWQAILDNFKLYAEGLNN